MRSESEPVATAALNVELPSESITVHADRGAVSDALFNLLTNAHKYGGDPARIEGHLDI